ncbi:hypothetical protein [Gemmatimonas sp.]|uniref:hypothetical protein n=1 Tax=Gemmatimonas sp. TaxID=1962908 RepID=UPI0035616C4D
MARELERRWRKVPSHINPHIHFIQELIQQPSLKVDHLICRKVCRQMRPDNENIRRRQRNGHLSAKLSKARLLYEEDPSIASSATHQVLRTLINPIPSEV